MPPAGFEAAILASEWPQTLAVDLSAIWIDTSWDYFLKKQCSWIEKSLMKNFGLET